MPFALVFIGLLLVVTGAKNTHAAFGRQLAGDFTGSGNFIYWLVALGAVGSLGYVEQLKTFSRTFMALIIIAMVLAQARDGKGGFFAALQQQLAAGCGSVNGGTGAAAGSGDTSGQGRIYVSPNNSGTPFSSSNVSPSDIMNIASTAAMFV